MAYRRPVRELQSVISSSEFTELMAFRRRNTLAPDQWWATATAAAYIGASVTGEWINPAILIPGQVDLDAIREAKERHAERVMTRRAKDNGGNR